MLPQYDWLAQNIASVLVSCDTIHAEMRPYVAVASASSENQSATASALFARAFRRSAFDGFSHRVPLRCWIIMKVSKVYSAVWA